MPIRLRPVLALFLCLAVSLAAFGAASGSATSAAAEATQNGAYFGPAMQAALDKVESGRATPRALLALQEWAWLAEEAGTDSASAQRLEGLATAPTHPLVAAHIRQRLADVAIATGNIPGAREQLKGLGIIHRFQLAGPFADDNGARFKEDEGVENLSRGMGRTMAPHLLPEFRTDDGAASVPGRTGVCIPVVFVERHRVKRGAARRFRRQRAPT